jgi:hypothetical protein
VIQVLKETLELKELKVIRDTQVPKEPRVIQVHKVTLVIQALKER